MSSDPESWPLRMEWRRRLGRQHHVGDAWVAQCMQIRRCEREVEMRVGQITKRHPALERRAAVCLADQAGHRYVPHGDAVPVQSQVGIHVGETNAEPRKARFAVAQADRAVERGMVHRAADAHVRRERTFRMLQNGIDRGERAEPDAVSMDVPDE